MNKERGSWTAVSKDLPVFTCTYKFGPGLANAAAVPCAGGVAIVSPPCGVPDSSFEAIAKIGKVRALVAPNAYHTMGLQPWKARFPDAEVFAPAQSIRRLVKKSGIESIKPVAELGSLASPDVEFIDMPHYKTGETLVRVRNGEHVAWYVTDVIFNMPTLPPTFPVKQIFAWAKIAPGLRPNVLAALFQMKDKRGVYGFLRKEVEKAPPTALIACHGDHILANAAEQLLAILPEG